MSSQTPATTLQPERQPASIRQEIPRNEAKQENHIPSSTPPTTPDSPQTKFRPETPDGKAKRPYSKSFTSITSRDHTDFTSTTNLRTMAVIVGALVAAVLFTIGHHLLLAHLDGRPTHPKSQYWFRNVSNVFADIVAILLGFSATTAMIQVTWRILRKKEVEISTISYLFTLPSYRSIFFLLPSTFKSKRVIFPLLYAGLIQALVLVSSFAPNALTVRPNYVIQNNLMVTDGLSRWVFTRKTLWVVYGPALATMTLLAILGLLCIRANGTSLDADFATFLLTTRNAQLDQAFKGLIDPEDIRHAQLRHEHMGVFLLEKQARAEENNQEKARPRRSSETHV